MSSTDSYNEVLIQQRANLIAEQEKIKKEIKKSQLQADGLEHDLQIAQQAFSFAESTMIGRTRKLATLFGGILKSDDELVEKIQLLIKSAEEDEKKAADLRIQIEEFSNAQSQSDFKIDDTLNALKRQNSIVSKKQEELKQRVGILNQINEKIIQEKINNQSYLAKYKPIAELMNVKNFNSDFFNKLNQKYHNIDENTRNALASLAGAAKINISNFEDFDAPQFFDLISYSYEKLQKKEIQQNKLNQEVLDRIQKTKSEISQKKKKIRYLNDFINTTTSQINRTNDDIKHASEMRQNELKMKLNSLQAKERKRIQSSLLFFNQNIDVSKFSVEKMIETQIQIINQTAKQLQEARINHQIRIKNSAVKLQRGINAVENAADAISVANRRLIRNIKPITCSCNV